MLGNMKHDVLRSVAHNIATSLASGIGLMIGVYELHVFEDARNSPSNRLMIDFLAGSITEGNASDTTVRAVRKYRDALPGLCESQGVSLSDFKCLLVSYEITPTKGVFTVKVTDRGGRTSRTEYGGYDGQKLKFIDSEGRLRPKPVVRSR